MYKPGAKMPAWLQDKSDDRSGKHESDNLHWVMFWLTRSDPRAPFADFQDASSLQEGAGADNWDGILDQSDPSVQHFVGDRHKKDASMTVKEMKKVMTENTEVANVPKAGKSKAKARTGVPRAPARVAMAELSDEEDEDEEENQAPVNARLAKATKAIEAVGGADPLAEVTS